MRRRKDFFFYSHYDFITISASWCISLSLLLLLLLLLLLFLLLESMCYATLHTGVNDNLFSCILDDDCQDEIVF